MITGPGTTAHITWANEHCLSISGIGAVAKVQCDLDFACRQSLKAMPGILRELRQRDASLAGGDSVNMEGAAIQAGSASSRVVYFGETGKFLAFLAPNCWHSGGAETEHLKGGNNRCTG
jgi:hypothetical protein